MALWQFELWFVPLGMARIHDADAIGMTSEQLDEIELKLDPRCNSKIFAALEAILPEKSSWSADLRIWGDEESHDIQVFIEDSRIVEMQARLDLNEPWFSLAIQLCALARDLDCVFVTSRGTVVRPSVEAMARAITNSPAARFVKDPDAFIKEAIAIEDELGPSH